MSRKRKWVLITLSAIAVLGVAGSLGTLQYFKSPQSCATCHIIESYVDSYQDSTLLDYAHAQAEEAVVCLDCHKYTISEKVGEIVTFVQGDYSDPLEEREFLNEACLGCHPAQELSEATEDMELNPHYSIHYRLAAVPPCSLCHKVHREQDEYCLRCHVEGAAFSDFNGGGGGAPGG